MNIHIISVVPELLESPFSHSIMKRAAEKGLMNITLHQLRDWAVNAYGMVDDYQFGGGAGMVMMCEPLINAIEQLNAENKFDEIIYLTPDGETFNQGIANGLSLKYAILFICGHYKGIDQRVRDHFVTREISIGDYVLSGGELAAAVVVDAILTLISALSISAIAAFYSIVGLATIFPGAFWPVVAMGSALEAGKLVCASWLYRNWHNTNKGLRSYLFASVIILSLITSMGIFGFLSKAHMDSGLVSGDLTTFA